MEMRMEPQPEMDVQAIVEQVEKDVARHEGEIKEIRKLLSGEGADPRTGLIWLATMQQETIIELRKLVAATGKAIEDHKKEGHASRLTPFQTMVWQVGGQIAVWGIIAFIGFAFLGIKITINGGSP